MATVKIKDIDQQQLEEAKREGDVYNQLGKIVTDDIAQQYQASINAARQQAEALPQQYDQLRLQNDYNTEVAARQFNDMMAMNNQQNAGLNRTEQAGLRAAQAQTSGQISAQQQAADQEIQIAIQNILAERAAKQAEARNQYALRAADRENQLLDAYRQQNYNIGMAEYQTAVEQEQSDRDLANSLAMLNAQTSAQEKLARVENELKIANARIDDELQRGRISLQYAEQRKTQAAAYAQQLKNAIRTSSGSGGSGSTGSTENLSDYQKLGDTYGQNILQRYGARDGAGNNLGYIPTANQGAAAQSIFNQYFTVGADGSSLTLNPNQASNEGAMRAFASAMAAAGLENYTTDQAITRLAQAQYATRNPQNRFNTVTAGTR